MSVEWYDDPIRIVGPYDVDTDGQTCGGKAATHFVHVNCSEVEMAPCWPPKVQPVSDDPAAVPDGPSHPANGVVVCPRCLEPMSAHDADPIGEGLVRYSCPVESDR